MSAAPASAAARMLGGAGALLAAPAWAADPRAGAFTGLREGGVLAFKGIRYARAARFAAPVIEPFAQAPTGTGIWLHRPQREMAGEAQSEDCLFLNIWTPDTRGARAVMVYFHGGAYTSGSVTDPLTQGAHLAAGGDVVVVTINHRLNALGYLWLQPLGARYADSGNLGQLDLIAALRWVRGNIAAFGAIRRG
jgi:para-nitrobenzyl esterase